MSAPAFFAAPETRAILARAAQAAGVPLSLHERSQGQEELLASWGACSACAYVNALPEGRAACQEDRESAAALALRRGRPVRFVCHMGFGCTVLAPFEHMEYTLSFGPWCPAGADQALEFDACRGLATLTGQPPAETFPRSLDDIHRTPAGLVDAVAEWTQADLARCYAEIQARSELGGEAGQEPDEAGGFPPSSGHRATSGAAEAAAAALLSANRGRLREILEGHLAEQRRTFRRDWSVQHMRLLAIVLEALEITEKTGVSVAPVRGEWVDWLTTPEDEATFRALLNRMCTRLVTLARNTASQTAQPGKTHSAQDYPALEALLRDHMTDPPTLQAVADRLGVSPAAVTRRLQRHFGVSYTGYLAKIRLEQAKELLRRTQLPLEAVALRIGLSDASNLGRLFRKHEQMSPGEYRKRYGRKS